MLLQIEKMFPSAEGLHQIWTALRFTPRRTNFVMQRYKKRRAKYFFYFGRGGVENINYAIRPQKRRRRRRAGGVVQKQ